MIRETYELKGTIQGVGFRPAVYRHATAHSITGSIRNCSGSVQLVIEGTAASLKAFLKTLPDALPPNAKLEQLRAVSSEVIPDSARSASFSIDDSDTGGPYGIQIPADLAMCADCRREIEDPSDRRHGYAFTTCTNCGPRYTVVNAMPYDRERTTLASFPLCPECLAEYSAPADRRFHAESIACPVCGPDLRFTAIDGTEIPGDAISNARRELAAGKILAVRGIGGYLLAVDAFNRRAIGALRARKRRPHKPFAVLASGLQVIRKYFILTPEAEALLTSPAAPIVILDSSFSPADPPLPLDAISPDTMTAGVMLPNSPLLHLLSAPLPGDPTPAFELLLMTSGNRRSEPICISNEEAFERLRDIADFVLSHNREINLRNDDSLAIIQHGSAQVWRRARGYAPETIPLPAALVRCVIGMGAEMKNTIAIGDYSGITVSPHIGDLSTPEALDNLDRVIETFPAFLNKMPACVAVDLHPDMHAARKGRQLALARNLPVLEVQHHHAHAAACLAENGRTEGLALVFDGTGLGTDGSIWGAELLDVAESGFKRIATFAGVPLPGGDAAVNQPLRQLVARFAAAGLDPAADRSLREEFGINMREAEIWQAQTLRNTNAPVTHAAGRLFDSFAALLGLAPDFITYEGQPAVRLEAAARSSMGSSGGRTVPFRLCEAAGLLVVDWKEAFQALAPAKTRKGHQNELAMAAHQAIARAAVNMVEYGLSVSKHRCVALSGGVFMNRILNELLIPDLERMGVEVLLHRRLPPNDGSISFGQVAVAGRTENR